MIRADGVRQSLSAPWARSVHGSVAKRVVHKLGGDYLCGLNMCLDTARVGSSHTQGTFVGDTRHDTQTRSCNIKRLMVDK